MAKGFFTQGVAVLFTEAPALEALEAALSGHGTPRPLEPADHWQLGGPGHVLPYRAEVGGGVLVDVVDRPWPDAMGHPQEDPVTFAAWTMGHFAPFAAPGSLERARAHSWHDRAVAQVAAGHGAFARARLTYVLGGDPDAPVMPEDADPVDELAFLSLVSASLLAMEGALCAFNPGGEVLTSPEAMGRALERGGVAPIDLWTNIRLFRLDDAWSLMDCVGCAQLDLPDLEVAFRPDALDPGDVDPFLRNLTLYLLQKGPVIEDGDTVDGPGGVRLRARALEEGAAAPPREVLRLVPDGDDHPPGSS